MNEPSKKLRFPPKRLSLSGDLKIRFRLLHIAIRKGFRRRSYRSFFTHMLAPALAVLIIFPFAKMGVGNYVYGNEAVVRGDVLYGWKRDMELGQLRAMNNPFNRANYFLQLSEWRMREADVAFGRETHGETGFLIPSARADDFVLRLPVNSVSEGLIAEGILFFQKSVSETKNVPTDRQADVLSNMKRTLAFNAFTLEEIGRNLPEDDNRKIIEPIRNQYLEIARDWGMQEFPKGPMPDPDRQVPQEPIPQEPMPKETPPENMPFVEPKMIDFSFYGDQWRKAEQNHQAFDQEFKRLEQKDWDLKEQEIRHFEEEKRRLREEEEMRQREAEMRKFEEEFLREAHNLDKNWPEEFVRPEEPQPKEPVPANCPEEFRPVCGQLPMPDCHNDIECRDRKPVRETFRNECELHRTNGLFLHEGKCEG